MTEPVECCYHCGVVLVERSTLYAAMAEIDRGFCCAGCLSAAQWLHTGGLGDFYRLRDTASPRVGVIDDYVAWDSPAFQRLYVRTSVSANGVNVAEIDVSLGGLRCAACVWLIPQIGRKLPGVHSIEVNPLSGRAHLIWEPGRIGLAEIAARLASMGYDARVAEAGGDRQRAQRRSALKRIALAGIAAMQAMMMSEALYFGGTDLDLPTRDFLRWMAMLLATPVVLWAAAPFFRGALLEWRLRRWGMDTLVALSVGLAYAVSVVETLRGGPEVYFDAAVMFVFFLLIARYVESVTRERANAAVARAQALPTTVQKLSAEGTVEISLHEVMIGDRLRVQAGHNIPADGCLQDESAELDESLLTGEPKAQRRLRGERVLAGSIALGAPLIVQVEALGAATWLAQLGRLVDAAQRTRPALQLRAERWARVFVVLMMSLALIAAVVWSQIDVGRVIPVALAVLAAACPCAFALAIPAAQAAAQANLARHGVLVVHADALERAAKIDRVAFDKTGTLTHGRPAIVAVAMIDPMCSATDCLAIAAALERGHRHPIANAFLAHDRGEPVEAAQVIAGDGVIGVIDGIHYRLGRQQFIDATAVVDDGRVWLSANGAAIAALTLIDPLREESAGCIGALSASGIESLILSGDASHAVRGVAETLGVRRARGDLRPDKKLSLLQAEQRSGHRIAMIGDGINDAPVLVAADLSIAMGEGAALAQRSADMILLRPSLMLLPYALGVAQKTERIVRQNLVWSVGYHAVMLPAALLGVMPPWLAAIGMSVSSLAVTLNAARLLRTERPARRSAARTHDALAVAP